MSQRLAEYQGVRIGYSADGRVSLKKSGSLCSNCRTELDEILTSSVQCGVHVRSDSDGQLVQVLLLRTCPPRRLKEACVEIADAIEACARDCLTVLL